MYRFLSLIFSILISSAAYGQTKADTLELLRAQVNYDEAQVPSYVLPPLLAPNNDGKLIDVQQWETERRPEILRKLQSEIYGVFPGDDIEVNFITSQDAVVFDGRARRKEIVINLRYGTREKDISLLIYVPTVSSTPAPLFVGYNFYGNHTIDADPNITIHESWSRNNESFGIENNRASEESRGVRKSRWPLELILSQGFGLATMYYGEVDPDFDDDFENGIHSLLGEEKPKEELSSISAWAWVLSRAMDYFEQDPSIDHNRIAVIGHSRLGKTSLWAGAADTRFAMVVSNDSGCGGAAISRRAFGETVHIINTAFPHWFIDKFAYYNERLEELPVDQHSLLAMVAPRPLYVASASEDLWADPKGEFEAALAVSPVYELYGLQGLESSTFPPVNQPLQENQVAYHVRAGGHDITAFDWEQFMKFAKKKL